MAEELKACPWCPLSTRLTTVSYFGTDYYQVLCSCGAHGPRRRTEIGAIESWNRRTPAPEPMIPQHLKDEIARIAFRQKYKLTRFDSYTEHEKMLVEDIGYLLKALSLPGDGEIQKGASDGE